MALSEFILKKSMKISNIVLTKPNAKGYRSINSLQKDILDIRSAFQRGPPKNIKLKLIEGVMFLGQDRLNLSLDFKKKNTSLSSQGLIHTHTIEGKSLDLKYNFLGDMAENGITISKVELNEKFFYTKLREDKIYTLRDRIWKEAMLSITLAQEIRGSLKEVLEESGFSVLTALDGKQAIVMYKQSLDDDEPFDAVIMDLVVPEGIGGKEAIHELLKIDPEIKCIVSSGFANEPVMANYSEYGFKAVITKPYTPDKLLEVLCHVLKG